MSALVLGARRGVLGALGVVALSYPLSGCKSCRSERPYTPFGVASALPSASVGALPSAAESASAAPSATPLSVKKAALAPASARRWTLEGRDIDAPDGRVFEQALSADFDANGELEILAWTVPAPDAKGAVPGELWLYPLNGAPQKVFAFPSFLPTGPSCTPATTLNQSSPGTATIDIHVSCTTQLLGHASTRALAVLHPLAGQAPRFSIRAADAAPGENLVLSLAAADEDGDHRDDYRFSVGLGLGSAAPELSVPLVFLDRAAGISRDPREPQKTLLELLKRDTGRAMKKKTAEAALTHVEIARRLLGSICAEGGAARVFDASGTPMHCGSLADVIDRLAAIEVSARLSLDDLGGALAVLSQDGWYFGSMRAAMRKQLVNDIEKHLPVFTAARSQLGVRPKLSPSPSYSPLAFEPSGALLIETESSVFRLAPDAPREEDLPPDGGVSAWPRAVTLAGGARWLGVSYSCDRSEIALLTTRGDNPLTPTTLLAPRPGVCGGARFADGFTPAPLAADGGLRALVGGVEVGDAAAGEHHPGAARSANGRFTAIPTPLGLYVRGPENGLWSIDGWSSTNTSGCVIDDGGRRAACLRAGRGELYVRSESASLP